MARLLMRHEDALSVLQQSTTWVLFQPRTILPNLYNAAQAWYDLKQNTPESLALPMRTILWQKLMSILAQRAQKVLDDQEAQSQAVDLDLYDPNHGFKYQKWDNKEGTMKAIPGKDPLPPPSQANRGDRQGDVGAEYPSPAPQSVPCPEAAAGADGGSHGHLAPGSRVARRGHSQVLGAPSAALPQLSPADAGVHPPSGSPPTVSTGPAAAIPPQLPEHSASETAAGLLALLPRLQLLNPSNYCYSHACLLAYLWLVGTSPLPHHQVLGREPIRSFLKQAQSRPRIHLWSLLPWRQAMRAWRNPARQQDAADYLLHLHQVLNAPCFQGLWQSYDDSRHLRDEGGVCPLILSGIHDDSAESLPLTTVQAHVQRWHNQHHKHALIAGTDVVALQLSRFSNARGIATKLHHRIKAEPDILLPQWTSTGILWRTYQLQAMIQHIGDRATTGHYRAALQPVSSSSPQTDSWFHTDDNQEAQRVHISALETTSYILFYTVRWTEDIAAHSGP